MKIHQLFACLSKEELKLLRKAVNSPLYNTNKNVVRLFEILRPLHPQFEDSTKSRAKLFKKLFPKESYNDYKLRWHFTELTKVIEQLLLYLNQERDQFERQKRLTEVYRERKLYPLFLKGNTDLLEQLAAETPNAATYLETFHLLSTKYFHPLHDKYHPEDTTLEAVSKNLDGFFVIQKLRLALAHKANQQVFNTKTAIDFIAAIKIAHKNGFQKENKLFKLYLQALDLVDAPDSVNFDQFEVEVFSPLPSYQKIDQQFIFYSCINFILKKVNEGAADAFEDRILKWYQFGLKYNMILVSGKITEATFANIVINGCKKKQFQWAEQFIADYKEYLPAKNKEANLSYYWGLFYYLKGDWNKAIEFLTSNRNDDIHPPRTRIAIIRTTFEQFLLDDSYLSLLLAHLQSFESFVRRGDYYTRKRQTYYLSFIKITRLLAKKIHKGASPKEIQTWFETKTLTGFPKLAKNWLQEKVNNL